MIERSHLHTEETGQDHEAECMYIMITEPVPFDKITGVDPNKATDKVDLFFKP